MGPSETQVLHPLKRGSLPFAPRRKLDPSPPLPDVLGQSSSDLSINICPLSTEQALGHGCHLPSSSNSLARAKQRKHLQLPQPQRAPSSHVREARLFRTCSHINELAGWEADLSPRLLARAKAISASVDMLIAVVDDSVAQVPGHCALWCSAMDTPRI